MKKVCKIICSLFVTLQCNISCSYCFIKKKPTRFNIEKLVPIDYNKYDYISVLGGEPGMLTLHEIKTLLLALEYIPNNKILIVTNGLFIEKYYNYCPKDFNYSYHIVDIENPKLFNYDNIQHMVVVTKKNIKSVINLVKENNDVIFQIVESCFENLFKYKDFIVLLKQPNIILNKIRVHDNPNILCNRSIHLYDEI